MSVMFMAALFGIAVHSGQGAIADVPWAQYSDLGSMPPRSSVRFAMTLRYHHQAELDRLVELQADPQSPLYRHWLTNAEFTRAFAPTQGEYTRVLAVLRTNGFQIVKVYPNRTVVDATGPVYQIERFFGTSLHRVLQPGYGIRYTNVRPAYEPAALRSLVLGVSGFSGLSVFHTDLARYHGMSRIEPDVAGPPLRGPVNPLYGTAGYGPLAFSAGYDLPVQHTIPTGGSYDGTGRTSGVVIDADFLDSDLATFLKYFHIVRTGPPTTRVLIDNGPSPGLSGDSGEATLDVETIVSNAPGTALRVYEMPQLAEQFIIDAYDTVVSDNVVDTLNSSFGGCELTLGATASLQMDAVAEQGVAEGITFHASTGDGGANGDCVAAPADGPHVTAVGGTALYVTKRGDWRSETGWSGSGGGYSVYFPVPSWQKNVKWLIQAGRNVPDVAFDASPATGTAFYMGGSWDTSYDPLGGTSLASPIFGAALTEMAQVSGTRWGLAAASLFHFWKKNRYGSGNAVFFHDIIVGNNGGYVAGRGYDQVTGIGSFDAWNLANSM